MPTIRAEGDYVQKEQFSQAMANLAAAFRIEITPATLSMYWRMLGRFDAELFDKVAEHIVIEHHRFPTIATFHEVCRDKFSKEITGEWTTKYRAGA